MVVSEWWDSPGNSREEKYGVLLETVRSMGKKCTAQRLENVIEENNLNLMGRNLLTNSAFNEIENGNLDISDTVICSVADVTGSDGQRGIHNGENGNRCNPAICSAADVVSHDSNNGESMIDTRRNGNHFNLLVARNEPSIERDNDEVEYPVSEVNRSVQNEVLDVFEGSGDATSSCETERPFDIPQLDSPFNSQPTIATFLYETEMTVSNQLDTAENNAEKYGVCSKETKNCVPNSRSISGGAGLNVDRNVNGDVWVDVFEQDNTDNSGYRMLNDTENNFKKDTFKKRRFRVGHKEDLGLLQLEDEEKGLNVDVDVCTSTQPRLLSPDHNAGINLDDPNVVYHLLPEVHMANAPGREHISLKQFDNGMVTKLYENVASKQGVLKEKVEPFQGDISVKQLSQTNFFDQNIAKICSTGVESGQTGIIDDQAIMTDAMNDQTCAGGSEIGVVNGHASKEKDQTGVAKGKTGKQNHQSTVVNGQTGVVNGQTGVVNGQTGVVNGQSGVVDEQIGTVDDKISGKKGTSKNNRKGFLHRLFRLFRRRRHPIICKADAEFAL